jgi:hypothetical protein
MASRQVTIESEKCHTNIMPSSVGAVSVLQLSAIDDVVSDGALRCFCIHTVAFRLSDQSLRARAHMSGIFISVRLANYRFGDPASASLGAIDANFDLQREFCAGTNRHRAILR